MLLENCLYSNKQKNKMCCKYTLRRRTRMLVKVVTFVFVLDLTAFSICLETEFIKPIVNDRMKHISVCNLDNNDEISEELVHVAYHNDLWLAPWNCLESGIPELNDGIIILNQALPEDVTNIFKKEGIQVSWMVNVWFILTSDLAPHPTEFMNLSPVKVGLNANIFIMDRFTTVGQVIGKATFDVNTKVINYCSRQCTVHLEC